ncbi:MAG: hypothetical protein Kow0088_12570 [Anaerolineales bacterium]
MMERETSLLPRLIALIALLLGLGLIFPFERGSAALRQARLAEQKGNFATAAKLYTQASRVFFWDKTNLQIQAAQNAAQAADYALVITLLSPLQEDHLLPSSAQVLLAQAYLATDQPEAALYLRQELAEGGYSTQTIDVELHKILTEQGRYEQTIPILRTLAATQPDNATWQYRLGLVLAAESPAEAIKPLQQAAQLDVNYQTRVAVLLEQLTQSSTEPALTYLYSGRGLAAIDEWPLAGRAFTHAVDLRPDFAEAWAYLGLARFRLATATTKSLSQQFAPGAEKNADQDPPGLAELRLALEINPHSQVALAFSALIWQELGEAQLALQSTQEAFQLYPDDLNVRLQYAQALAQNGDLEGGWQILNQGIETSPKPLAARQSLVLYCLQYGYRLSESALPLAQSLVGQTPQDAKSLDLLAQVYLALEEQTLAQQTLEQALSLDANYAPAWLHLGIVHLESGNSALARSHFQKAIEIAPFSPSGQQAKRYLEIYLP